VSHLQIPANSSRHVYPPTDIGRTECYGQKRCTNVQYTQKIFVINIVKTRAHNMYHSFGDKGQYVHVYVIYKSLQYPILVYFHTLITNNYDYDANIYIRRYHAENVINIY